MANVIQLTDNYIATSSVYDTNQNKTQTDINSSVSSSISTINSNFSALSSKVTANTNNISSLNTYVFRIGNGKTMPLIYGVGTQTQTKIYIKVTSNYSAAHVGGLLVMEQNGPALLAVLTPSGWSTALNGNGWKCSYSAPQWTITAGSWTGGYFIPFSNYTYSISYA